VIQLLGGGAAPVGGSAPSPPPSNEFAIFEIRLLLPQPPLLLALLIALPGSLHSCLCVTGAIILLQLMGVAHGRTE